MPDLLEQIRGTRAKFERMLREAGLISERGLAADMAEAIKNWIPMPPWDGPPLARGLGIKWPWRKER